MRYLSADYILPVTGSPVRNGILVMDDEGRIADLLDPVFSMNIPDQPERYNGFLCPGFINSHCHLELSWARGGIAPGLGLNHFVRSLQAIRSTVSEDEVSYSIRKSCDSMWKKGIVAIGDISNGLSTLACKEISPILFHTFCELFGSDPIHAEAILQRGLSNAAAFSALKRNGRASVTPHATYSLSEELFRLIRINQTSQDLPLSIHHQENEDENSFFLNGTGRIAERRLAFNPGIVPFSGTGKRPLESIAGWLDQNAKLLLVHNTLSQEEDINFALDYFREIHWCLCPKANLFIEGLIPDIDLFRKKDCKITIGTDSLASNDTLSILEEMKAITRFYPEIPLCEMVSWATRNGAEFLGFENLGTFSPGSSPGVVLIENVDIDNLALRQDSWSRLLIPPANASIS